MILVYSIIKNKKEMLYKYKLIPEKKLYNKNNILITLGNILTIFQLTRCAYIYVQWKLNSHHSYFNFFNLFTTSWLKLSAGIKEKLWKRLYHLTNRIFNVISRLTGAFFYLYEVVAIKSNSYSLISSSQSVGWYLKRDKD